MRPGKGCQSCRTRHVKCVTIDNQSSCTKCVEASRTCIFEPKFRFRQVAYVETTSNGNKSRTTLDYEQNQTWVSTANPVGFVLEDTSGAEYDGYDQHGEQSTERHDRGLPDHLFQAAGPLANGQLSRAGAQGDNDFRAYHDTLPEDIPWPFRKPSKPYSQSNVLAIDISSPASIAELAQRHAEIVCVAVPLKAISGKTFGTNDSATRSPAASLPTAARLKLSRREAFLLHHFVQIIAPWCDACDLSSHFALEIPRRAVQIPMVLYAVLALASRHQACWVDQTSDEASFYHDKCLGLVIDALSGSKTSFDDNLLAAVNFLRIYEEIDPKTDEFLHIDGVGRLMTAIPTFAHSGGLAEAACWHSLRQDIFVSLLTCQSPTLNLESYELSSAFTFRDEGACANVIILLFAKILRLLFSPHASQDESSWALLEEDVERWNEQRARLFQPVYDEGLDLDEGRPFPIICMINPPQVVAMQYYYACKIYLKLHRPDSQSASGFDAAKCRRTIERLVAYYLAVLIGLAVSNEMVENANFTAHHLLRTCGYCVSNTLQRQYVIRFLERMQQLMGWSTAHTIAVLETQWRDLDDG